ncbi:hypothetical protein GRJ2_001480700 [Grus japonensis]|uniref:Uncharacterized protein n=1 Tax=Grus japonensis TaxID=30415 RepID=A0ABC9WXJ2_GRUJA
MFRRLTNPNRNLCHPYAMEFSPARHLPFTDFGKHRCENKFKHICNCRGQVIEVQETPLANFNFANTGLSQQYSF